MRSSTEKGAAADQGRSTNDLKQEGKDAKETCARITQTLSGNSARVEIVLEGENVTFAVLDDLAAAVERTRAAELDISFTDGSWVDDFAANNMFPAIARNTSVTSLVFRRGLHAELAARLSPSIAKASGLTAVTILHGDVDVDPASIKSIAEGAAAKVGAPFDRFIFTRDGLGVPEAVHTYAAALGKMREKRTSMNEILTDDEGHATVKDIVFGEPGPGMLRIDALVGAAMVDVFWGAHKKKVHDSDIPSVTTKPYWLPRSYLRPNHKVPAQRPAARKTPLWLMDRVAVSLPSIGVLADADRARGAAVRRPVRLRVTASPAW